MGIAPAAFTLLCDLKHTNPDFGNGKIMQIGRQRSFVSDLQINDTLNRFGIAPTICLEQVTRSQDDLGDQRLFNSLGFDQVDSVDYSRFEGATYEHDFNLRIPNSLDGQYDCVYDGGTIEHIFDIRQVFANIHHLLKENGYACHSSPSNNHVDHGFYMFSPTLFYDYYSANGYKIVKSMIFEYEVEHDKKPWIIHGYTPGCIDHLSFGGWKSDKLLGIWFVARKLKDSTCHIIPQQGSYRRAWAQVHG